MYVLTPLLCLISKTQPVVEHTFHTFGIRDMLVIDESCDFKSELQTFSVLVDLHRKYIYSQMQTPNQLFALTTFMLCPWILQQRNYSSATVLPLKWDILALSLLLLIMNIQNRVAFQRRDTKHADQRANGLPPQAGCSKPRSLFKL